MTTSAAHPTHHRKITVDGVEIFYREAGDPSRTTILLLHGYPTSSTMYAGLIPLLSDHFHLLAPDYPGFGLSAVPSRESFRYTFDGLTEIVEHFLEAVGIDRFVPYMMDFGGPVGNRLTLGHPERVPALIFQNAPLYSEPFDGWWSTLVSYWKDPSEANRERVRDEYLSLDTAKGLYTAGVRDVTLLNPERWVMDHYLANRPGVGDVMLDLLGDIAHNAPNLTQMQALIRDRTPPALVATGINDPLFPRGTIEPITQDDPQAEFHGLDTGHNALEDHAAEIASLIRAFLERHGL